MDENNKNEEFKNIIKNVIIYADTSDSYFDDEF